MSARRGDPGALPANRRAGAARACQRVSAADGRGGPARSSRVNTPDAAAASCSRRVTVRSTALALPDSITLGSAGGITVDFPPVVGAIIG